MTTVEGTLRRARIGRNIGTVLVVVGSLGLIEIGSSTLLESSEGVLSFALAWPLLFLLGFDIGGAVLGVVIALMVGFWFIWLPLGVYLHNRNSFTLAKAGINVKPIRLEMTGRRIIGYVILTILILLLIVYFAV